MIGYCHCGRPATTSGSCGHGGCNETLTVQLSRAMAANPAPPAPRLTREQMTQAFVERCSEIRHGSPNAFYSHVDKFCKAWLAAEGETPPAHLPPAPPGFRYIKRINTNAAGNTDEGWYLYQETPPAVFPIQLTAAQEQTAKEWAADDRLWTTQDTVEFNLRVFARKVLALVPPAPVADLARLTAERDRLREALERTRDYIRTAMRPQNVAAAASEGIYDRAHRAGLQHALNALNHEFTALAAEGEAPPDSILAYPLPPLAGKEPR